MPAGPDLLVILTDHGRADSVRSVQAGIAVTPAANRLADAGWHGTRCYTTCPLCVPARTALATGRYPWKNGVEINDFEGRSPSRLPTVQEHLAKAGYRVGHVGMHHVRTTPDLRERLPFAAWVDQSDHRPAARRTGIHLPATGPTFRQSVAVRQADGDSPAFPYSTAATGVWEGPVEWFRDNFFADRAIDFLRQRGVAPGPRALFLNLWAPHPPLVVPEPYASLFAPAALDLPSNVGRPAAAEPPSRRDGPPARLAAGLSESDWRRVWAAHLGLTRLADDAIARVLDATDLDRTVVVLASDHGEHLGQHAMYQKMELYEPAVRVPLIAAGPGITRGRVDPGLCSLIDLAPTLLELAGAEPLNDFDGRSLVPAWHGGMSEPDRVLPMQYVGNQAPCEPSGQRRGVVTDRWKYVEEPGGTGVELYDLANDPLEMSNLADEPQGQVTRRQLGDVVASTFGAA
jgi:choline-sulfatase